MSVRTSATDSGELKKLPMPDVGDFVFLFVMWLNLFVIPNHLFEDGSTGWHLVAGDFILNTATIPNVDLFSNTFPHKAWVAYEWLYDLFMAIMVELGGMKLLAVVLTAAIGFLFLAIYDRARREGAGIATTFFLVIVAILVSAMHWLARPHLVTFWCVWIFITTLEDFYRGTVSTRKMFLWLCPTMLLWVNCHPAFMLGLVIASVFVVSTAVRACFDVIESERDRFRLKRNHLLVLFVALLAITFVNPYGYHLHQYILSYLRGSEILAATDEFLSPSFKGGFHTTCLEILYIAFASGLLICQRRITMPGLLTCLLFGYASLTAVRNMPLFAIAATPYIGGLLARHTSSCAASELSTSSEDAYRIGLQLDKPAADATISDATTADVTNKDEPVSSPVSSSVVSFARRIKKSLADFEAQEAYCKMHLLPIGYTLFLVVVAICGGSFLGKPFLTSTFSAKMMPVDTAMYVKQNHIDIKHMFNFDNWGGYLRYVLGQRVFIDDRADFYGYDFYYKYSVAMAAAEGWQKVLADQNIDWVLFPKNSALANALQKEKDWKLVASDESSALFQRIK